MPIYGFAYLLAFATLPFVVVLWWAAGRRAALKGLAACMVVETLLAVPSYRALHYWNGWNLNIDVTRPSLVGGWRNADRWVELRENGTFTDGTGISGPWSATAQDVQIGELTLHAALHDGQLRLIPASSIDPDDWDKWLACAKEPDPHRQQ